MIRITCTHCRQVLSIDEGFAGGVCRCQHCGTIQTVPAVKSGGGKTSALGAAARTLYRAADHSSHSARHDGSGEHMLSDSTLEELAQIVSSSGLRSNSRRLREAPPTPAAKALLVPTRSHHLVPWLIASTAIILVLLLVIAVLLRRSVPAAVNAPGLSPSPAAAPVQTANFAGLPISAEDTVVYVLDDGGSAADVLPAMEAACFASIKSLGPQRRFKVILWRDASPVYPPDGTARATDDEEANCEAAFRDAFAQGNTDVDAAFKLAVASQPDAIVLVTAKGAQLPDDFSETVLTIRGESHVKVYTVGINGDSTSDASQLGQLATVAAHTGGAFLNISSGDLANRAGH